MAIIVFYKKRGPVVVDALPSASILGAWTYALIHRKWHWVVSDGPSRHNNEWFAVPENHVPKEYRAWGLILG